MLHRYVSRASFVLQLRWPELCLAERGSERRYGFVYEKTSVIKHTVTNIAETESVLCNDSTEPSPPYTQPWICLFTNSNDLGSDMFAFSITIRPYHDHLDLPSFSSEVSCNSLGLFLDLCTNGGFEQLQWIA